MKKKLSFILAIVLVVCMAAMPAAALPAASTVEWKGSNTTYTAAEITDNMKLEVSVDLYIDTNAFSTFESCNLSLKYDDSIIAVVGSPYDEQGYNLFGDTMDFGYNLIMSNTSWTEADENGLCTTVYFPMRIKDAATFIKNGGIEIGLGIFNEDVSINVGDKERYGRQAWLDGVSDVEINVAFSPITIKIKDGGKDPEPTKEEWTVSYETNGGNKLDSAKVEKGKSITLPTPVKDGNKFDGWYIDAEFKTKANSPFAPTADTTLYAKWTEDKEPEPAKEEWTITYETNGGNKLDPSKVEKGKEITLPTPEKEGYKFGGWYSDEDLKTKVTTKYTPEKDITLYAKWTEKTPASTEWTISYETNGGNKLDPSKVTKGESIKLPTPTRSGYTFAGWYTDEDFKDRVKTTYTPEKDITLYAKWTANTGSGSVPQTGFHNTTGILIGVIAVLVVCAGAIVFVRYRKNKNEN